MISMVAGVLLQIDTGQRNILECKGQGSEVQSAPMLWQRQINSAAVYG